MSFTAVPIKVVAGFAWLIAAITVGWVIAAMFWWLAAPAPAPVPEVARLSGYAAMTQAIVSRHLLGEASVAEVQAERSLARYRVLGAMTGSAEKPGFAILAEEGKAPVAAVEGEVLADGATLLEVLPNSVRLRINEQVEEIEIMRDETNMQRGGSESGATPIKPGAGTK